MLFLYKVTYKGKTKLVEALFPHQALKKAFPSFKWASGITQKQHPLTVVYSGATEEEGWARVTEEVQEDRYTYD